MALIAEMCATWQTPRLDADVEWAGRARTRLLAMSVEEALDLVREARHFGLGEQAYRKKFKRLCGLTPTLFRSRHLVELACHRLISGMNPSRPWGLHRASGANFIFPAASNKSPACPPANTGGARLGENAKNGSRVILDSALSRPENLFAYDKPTIFEVAAAYAYGIAKNHPFLDGNKRTAFITAIVFLEANGHPFTATTDD